MVIVATHFDKSSVLGGEGGSGDGEDSCTTHGRKRKRESKRKKAKKNKFKKGLNKMYNHVKVEE